MVEELGSQPLRGSSLAVTLGEVVNGVVPVNR
jgi:hypothetical protein